MAEAEADVSVSYRSLILDQKLIAMMMVGFVVMFGYEVPAPVLSSIAEGVGVTDAQIGLVMTAFAIPTVAFVPVTGVLADLYGRRWVLLPSLVVFGAAGVAVAFVDTFAMILVLRFFQGAAFAGVLPISVVVLGDVFDGARGSAAQGFRVSAAGAATIVVPPIAGYLAGIGWEVPFLLYGVAVLIAVYVFFVVPESIEAYDTDDGVLQTLREYAVGIKVELTDRQLAVLVTGGFVRGFTRLALLTFIPLFAIRVLDASLVEAGFILSARGIARLVLPPLSGYITEWFSRKHGLLGALTIGGASTLLVPLAPSILVIGFLMFGYTVGDAFISPLLKDAVANHASDDHRAGVINSMYVFQNSGEAIAPAFFGVVLAIGGFAPIFVLSAVVIGIYALTVALWLDHG